MTDGKATGPAGPRCVVVDGGGVLAPLIAGALVDLGATALVVPVAREDRQTAADVLKAVHGLGQVEILVYVPGGEGLVERKLTEIDDTAWDQACEAVLRQGLHSLQGAFAAMRSRGGRIIFVIPTIALTGAAGLVPLASACEGLRGLAKSAARAWGVNGITVNCVASSVEVFGIKVRTGSSVPRRWPAALPPPEAREIAKVVLLLGGDLAGPVTGATVAVDGGVVMAP